MTPQDRKKISVINKYAVENFVASDWLAFGQITGKVQVVTSHPRLLRALGFNDDDYEYAAADVINELLQDSDVIEAVLDHFDIDLWYRQKDPEKYQRIFGGATAKAADFWVPGYFRLFVSHISANKARMSAMKGALAYWGISAFVAHEDIQASREWRDEVEAGLETMQMLVALVQPGFKESDWCTQEVGYALGRKIDILPLRAGLDPFGFFGKFQGIPIKGLMPDAVALEIVRTLLRKPQHRDVLLRSMSGAFAALQSDRKVKQFGILDSWTITSDQQLRLMLEQSALSDYEKKELKLLIGRVGAFTITGPSAALEDAEDIPF
jgi:hypothetical protein